MNTRKLLIWLCIIAVLLPVATLIVIKYPNLNPIRQTRRNYKNSTNKQVPDKSATTGNEEKGKADTGNTYNYHGTYNYYSDETTNGVLFVSSIAVAIALISLGVAWYQATIIAGSERPWLMFKPQRPNLWGHLLIFTNNVPPFTVNWDIINVGRSPAFLTKLVPEIKIVPIAETPPPLPKGGIFNLILSPKSPPEDRHGSNSILMLTAEQFLDMHNGELCVWLYGIAEYADNIRKPHTTKFCCRWFLENGNWVYDPVGPKGWTEYT